MTAVNYKQVFFPEFTSSLEIVSPPLQRVSQYNCFAYALGLDVWVRTHTFHQAVLNQDIKETEAPKSGDIVVYYEGNLIKHAVKYESQSKVISKWAGGPIFKHETFMCPATYGNGFMHSRRIIDEGYRWDEKLNLMEEWDFVMTFAEKYPDNFLYIPYVLFHYHQRFGTDGLVSNAKYDEWAEAFEYIYQKHKNDKMIQGQGWYPNRVEKYKKLYEEYKAGNAPEPYLKYFS
jgi:hypothetical protein